MAFPTRRRDDAIGDPRGDDEPEPQAKPNAGAIRRGDALAGAGALRLERDLDGVDRRRSAIDHAGQELPHGDRVVVVAQLPVAQDLDPGRAVERDAAELAGVVEVEDAKAAQGARVDPYDPPHHRPRGQTNACRHHRPHRAQ